MQEHVNDRLLRGLLKIQEGAESVANRREGAGACMERKKTKKRKTR
jgi:hypothetical protein